MCFNRCVFLHFSFSRVFSFLFFFIIFLFFFIIFPLIFNHGGVVTSRKSNLCAQNFNKFLNYPGKSPPCLFLFLLLLLLLLLLLIQIKRVQYFSC